jgi:hypothetical protein
MGAVSSEDFFREIQAAFAFAWSWTGVFLNKLKKSAETAAVVPIPYELN